MFWRLLTRLAALVRVFESADRSGPSFRPELDNGFELVHRDNHGLFSDNIHKRKQARFLAGVREVDDDSFQLAFSGRRKQQSVWSGKKNIGNPKSHLVSGLRGIHPFLDERS